MGLFLFQIWWEEITVEGVIREEKMNKEKVVVICSGGMDSVTLLHLIKKDHENVSVLTFDYGQRHKKEIECAKEQCSILGVSHKVLDLSWFGKEIASDSALTGDKEVPHGHYEEANMKQTVFL